MHSALLVLCCVHELISCSLSDVVPSPTSDLGRVKAYADVNGAVFEHMPTKAIEMVSLPSQAHDEANIGTVIGRILILLCLLVLSGLFAGLGLGLMSLNLTELKILADVGDDEKANLDERKRGRAAKSIITVRSKGHLLLTTLLLGSVAVNSLASIVAADLTTGLWGFLVSTTLIVLFGEIIPQSLCSKYAVEIGGKSVPFVRCVILLFYIVAKPVSMILDHFLGSEADTLLTNNQLRQLTKIHAEEGIVSEDENRFLQATLTHHDKIATDIMTKTDQVFMISVQSVLNTSLIKEVSRAGFSRIPLYGESPDNIVSILHLKDLILVDPAEPTAVADVIKRRETNVIRVDGTCSLNALLDMFKSIGRSVVLVEEAKALKETQKPSRLLGIVTMTDVVNALLPGFSRGRDPVAKQILQRKSPVKFNVRSIQSLRHLECNSDAGGIIVVETLVKQLQQADTIFSAVTSSGISLSMNQLANFLADCEMINYDANSSENIILRRNEELSYCLLLLHGKLRIDRGSGSEDDCEPGSVFALDCLKMQGACLSDFELKTVANVSAKCLQIPRIGFKNLLCGDESSFTNKNLDARLGSKHRNLTPDLGD